MGGVLHVAGVTGFLENRQTLYDDSDAESAEWRRLLEAWYSRFGDRPVIVSDIWRLLEAERGDPIDLALGDGNERSQKSRLGWLLVKNRDKRAGGFWVVRSRGTRDGSALWKVVKATNAPHEPANREPGGTPPVPDVHVQPESPTLNSPPGSAQGTSGTLGTSLAPSHGHTRARAGKAG
jgi:hypothetical protein